MLNLTYCSPETMFVCLVFHQPYEKIIMMKLLAFDSVCVWCLC